MKAPRRTSIDNLDPQHIHTEDDERIFVFGSNIYGIHGAGAAAYAREKLGAEWGVGEGLTGRAYALPTCYAPGEPLTYQELAVHINNFLKFAQENPGTRFFVSKVGCGIAGFPEEIVAMIFRELGTPDNCDLPPDWRT
jgi:hypothetical protein